MHEPIDEAEGPASFAAADLAPVHVTASGPLDSACGAPAASLSAEATAVARRRIQRIEDAGEPSVTPRRRTRHRHGVPLGPPARARAAVLESGETTLNTAAERATRAQASSCASSRAGVRIAKLNVSGEQQARVGGRLEAHPALAAPPVEEVDAPSGSSRSSRSKRARTL